MNQATAVVAEIAASIEPLDETERAHRDAALAWLAGTDDIFRRAKPVTPPQHLVSYVVLVDPVARALYLGRHLSSDLDLPMGGHVEPGEHPVAAARREAVEELGIEPEFTVVGERPLMLTVTTTVGPYPHVDVSLWHVIRGDSTREYPLDPAEFAYGKWWDLDPYGLPATDPHLPRFLRKLDNCLQPDRQL
ncbi:NUDIX domain-containing protein [Nocardia blacklockiae]|uniref:NUDIX domain-containing protein n=1 Tax=Nocardia blacklockiae TaxID=480036 RepID=UPI0018939194|nr:NUDIX hydrolase [Nocardia blacklockiae]MBF6175304.1 NUDIX domain-containing protein [Nocardia blacklockiae]